MRTGIFTMMAFSTWALVGCPHSDGVDTTPASAASPSVALPDDATPPVAAAMPDASAPDASPPAATTAPDMTSAPAYPPAALHDTFSKAEAKLVACYLPGKKRDPKLRGKVIVKLTINGDGSAHQVVNEQSTLLDPEVIACVIRTVKALRFTKPVEGSVTVIYPFIFRPTGDDPLILTDEDKP
jgi:outer membrane biosynthesis protein TonB